MRMNSSGRLQAAGSSRAGEGRGGDVRVPVSGLRGGVRIPGSCSGAVHAARQEPVTVSRGGNAGEWKRGRGGVVGETGARCRGEVASGRSQDVQIATDEIARAGIGS